MSQYPPPPGQPFGQPQQPPFAQAPQQPPYGQPPYGQPGFGQPPRGTSGAAIASLICGIVACVPIITSLLAVILGFVGIGATKNNRAKGRGLAIAGLILGLLGLAGWASVGGLVLYGLGKGKQMANSTAKPFVQAVSQADYTTAANYSTMTEPDMTALHDQIATWGELTDMSVNKYNFEKNSGTPGRVSMGGHATFATGGQKDFDVVMNSMQGKFKVETIEFK